MTIICADDEQFALDILSEAVREAAPDATVEAFTETEPLLNFAEKIECDVAFLDIQMRETNGIALAKQLKDINPNINIVFVTGYDQYTGDAINMRASGYVMKPATKEKILDELENLRNPIQVRETGMLRVQCFGNFEVFANGAPVAFRHSKTKELFAYMIDRRGANCTMGELMAVLYEDKPDSLSQRSQLRNLISDLRSSLKTCGFEKAIIKGHNVVAVNIGAVECDYYDFLNMLPSGINSYRGEYMRQYSWAEVTTAALPVKEH